MPRSIIKTFKYQPQLHFDPKNQRYVTVSRPVVPVRLSYKHKIGKVSVECLIDSGADINLFPADWGESVGINIKKGTKDTINGIGAIGVEAFLHEIMIYLGPDISFLTRAFFSYHQEIPLLGRNGFIDHFKAITFLGKMNQVVLEY